MTLPQILADLLQMLFDLAVPAATCTLVLAGIALRQEGGVNFEAGGKFQRWIIWSVIFLTLPQFLSWFLAQTAISMPSHGAVSGWVALMEQGFKNFVSNVLVSKLLPLFAAFMVIKAVLDVSQGHSPLGSIVTALFLLSVSGTVQMIQAANDGSQTATVDALYSLWSYVAGTILPETAGLAVVGAILNYVRQKPFMPLVGTALAFLCVSGLWALVQAMVQ